MFLDKEVTLLDKAIMNAEAELGATAPDDDKYGIILERLTRLHKVRNETKTFQVSPDTLVMAATNLIGIILIIKHERFEIITTRAMSMLSKTK